MVISMDNRAALISVIVPVYNGESYLEACIDSIRSQTYPNLEMIIINDGSTDRTGELCTELQKRYHNITILTLQDEGVSAARNAGIEAAHGDFLMFVDADDRIKPQMIQMLYDCIVSTDSDIAGCRFSIWRTEEEWRRTVSGKNADDERKDGDQKDSALALAIYHADNYVRDAILQGNSRCWSKLYRKSAIGKIRFREGLSIGEDMLFLLDLLDRAEKIAEMEYPGYGYFQNPNGAINRKFTPDYMDQITCWELARKRIEEMALEKDLYVQATTILMMGIMLTAGKLAMLTAAERRGQKEYIRICHDKLKEAMRIEGAYRKLSAGYQIKTKLFYYLPKLYLALYHLKKYRRELAA